MKCRGINDKYPLFKGYFDQRTKVELYLTAGRNVTKLTKKVLKLSKRNVKGYFLPVLSLEVCPQ